MKQQIIKKQKIKNGPKPVKKLRMFQNCPFRVLARSSLCISVPFHQKAHNICHGGGELLFGALSVAQASRRSKVSGSWPAQLARNQCMLKKKQTGRRKKLPHVILHDVRFKPAFQRPPTWLNNHWRVTSKKQHHWPMAQSQ